MKTWKQEALELELLRVRQSRECVNGMHKAEAFYDRKIAKLQKKLK